MQANWTYIAITTCLLLAAALVWLEVRRLNKRRLLWRIFAVISASVALACIALPLRYQTLVNQSEGNKIVLLTDGFDTDSLMAADRLYTFSEHVKKAYPKAKLITPDRLSKTGTVHVHGYGLSKDELEQLNDRPLKFHQATSPAGVTNLSYAAQLKKGEALRVQGVYNNPSAQRVKLILKGLNTGVDSVVIGPNSNVAFELSTIPKTAGRVVYSIYADTTLQGSLPLQVVPAKPLKVLMLSASPDFETKFLKNWLSANGYAVALRSAISKDKFNTEFINTPQFSIDRLSTATLSKFDLLIGDLSVLTNLNSAESAAIKQQVTDNGLGIIVKADSCGKVSWLQSSFPVDRPSGKEPALAALIINGKKSYSNKLGSVSTHIIYREGTQPLIKNSAGQVLASSTIAGSGKIIFSTLNNTFSWMLAGDKADYTAVWSALISRAARKDVEGNNEVMVTALSFVNQPMQLQINANKQPQVKIDGDILAPIQNPTLPCEWAMLYRPKEKGWQDGNLSKNNTDWYVYGDSEWPTVQASAKTAVTKQYANSHLISDIVTKEIQQKVWIDVPKIYFYMLLLAACTFLWIETKLS